MQLIITILIVILFTFFISKLTKKLKLPHVVGLIVAGLILGYSTLKNMFLEPNTKFISDIGDIALLVLMFFAGMDSSPKKLYKESKDGLWITLFAALTSFILGFLAILFLGFSMLDALIVGICMSITAEATTATILLELKKLKTRIGSAIMDAGIFDDASGITLFIIVTLIFKKANMVEDFLLLEVIFAFFLGIVAQKIIKKEHKVMAKIEKVMMILVVPFFFISMGIRFDFTSLLINPLLLIVIIVVAITGKLIGTLFLKPFIDMSWKQLHLIGWAMNGRGGIDLALAVIAFRSNLLQTEIYSSIVLMTLVTTLLFPMVITRIIKKDPKIMD